MERRQIVFGALIVCLVVAVSAGAGDVALAGSAAHEGAMGVEFSIAGKNDRAIIEDLHPDGENTYRAAFWFNPSRLTMANKSGHFIFEGVGPKPATGSGEARVVEVLLWQDNRGRLRVRGFAHPEPGSSAKRVGTKTIRIDEDGWNHLVIEWRASSNNSTPDGLLRLTIDGGKYTGGRAEVVGKVGNQNLVIEKARLGAVRGVDAATSGDFSVDTFESFRVLSGE